MYGRDLVIIRRAQTSSINPLLVRVGAGCIDVRVCMDLGWDGDRTHSTYHIIPGGRRGGWSGGVVSTGGDAIDLAALRRCTRQVNQYYTTIIFVVASRVCIPMDGDDTIITDGHRLTCGWTI